MNATPKDSPQAGDIAWPWLPDGIGLDAHSLSILDPEVDVVHLRLRSGAAYPRTACGAGIGEWWSGKRDEVTCLTCRNRAGSTEESHRG